MLQWIDNTDEQPDLTVKRDLQYISHLNLHLRYHLNLPPCYLHYLVVSSLILCKLWAIIQSDYSILAIMNWQFLLLYFSISCLLVSSTSVLLVNKVHG